MTKRGPRSAEPLGTAFRSLDEARHPIGQATDDIIATGRKIASFLFEAGEAAIAFEQGRFRIAGTDREVDLFEVAAAALTRTDLPRELGVRSGGEGGTTPALAAVINAIVDALAELGVHHIEMPATPERVWRAIRAARASRSGRDHSARDS